MKYRAQLGGQPEPDVLLLRLLYIEGRPVVRAHLPEPFAMPTGDVEAVFTSADPVGERMSGTVETVEV